MGSWVPIAAVPRVGSAKLDRSWGQPAGASIDAESLNILLQARLENQPTQLASCRVTHNKNPLSTATGSRGRIGNYYGVYLRLGDEDSNLGWLIQSQQSYR